MPSARHASAWVVFEVIFQMSQCVARRPCRSCRSSRSSADPAVARSAQCSGRRRTDGSLKPALRLVEVEDDRLLLRGDQRVALLRGRIDDERDALCEHRIARGGSAREVEPHLRALQSEEERLRCGGCCACRAGTAEAFAGHVHRDLALEARVEEREQAATTAARGGAAVCTLAAAEPELVAAARSSPRARPRLRRARSRRERINRVRP